MNDADRKSTFAHYDALLKIHGYAPQSLGWKNGRHNLRYQILLSQWELDGTSVLDFGCGFGDLYGYCLKNGHKISYEGIDINPKLLEVGKGIYPDAKMELRDAFREGLPKKYDLIVSSGVHNFKLENNWDFIKKSFDLYNEHSTTGFAMNFLSKKVEYELDHTYHADPAQIVDLAYKYSNRVVLRNDYMPFEFTIFVDKRTTFDRSWAVYPEYLKFVQ